MTLAIPLLATAGFAVVTTEFVVVGILPLLARDLDVSIAQAGLLLTIWAFTVAMCGPPLTAMLGGVERRTLFATVMLLFAIANVIAALAANIWVLGSARVVAALALPVFWSMANETAARIAGPERAGKAVAQVFFGISAATVLGIPIGTFAAESFGWRAMFLGIAALCLVIAVLLALHFPRISGVHQGFAAQAALLRRPLFLAHLGLAALSFTAMFTGYTYLADMLQRLGGFDGHMVGLILVGFGAIGLIGNWLGGIMVDRHPLGATALSMAAGALAMAVLAPSFSSPALLVAVLALWGAAHAATFVTNSVRVMKAGSEAPAFAMAVTASVCNVGIGLGAIIGGQVIDTIGLGRLGFVGAAAGVVSLSAALLLWLVFYRPTGPAHAA